MDQAKQTNLRYLVLATGTLKQELLASTLSRCFPKERGRIFLPEREYWIRKTQTVGRKPLFPGYLFAHTDMSQKELYLFVRQNSRDIMTFVNELAVKALKDSGVMIDDQIWSELTADETFFLDRILDADGVERMSVGYKQGEHYNIVEGPLKSLEEHIVWSNRHDREARLDVAFREKPIIVGLELKPKKAFFPDGEKINNSMLMDDGTELDLKDLAQRMMRGE